MSLQRKLQTGVLLCGALALMVSAVRAQPADDNEYPVPAQTPEAAGEQFYQLLTAGVARDASTRRASFDWNLVSRFRGAISRPQLFAIFKKVGDNEINQLFLGLAQQKDEPQFQGQIIGKEGAQILVGVSVAPEKKPAVVVIAEDGGFRVDLKATIGRWNRLSVIELDRVWANYTGTITPALAGSSAFIANQKRLSCQTNLRQQALALMQYRAEHNYQMPPARKWMDELRPYLKNEDALRCPSLAVAGVGNAEAKVYGYAFNQNLNALKLGALANPTTAAAIYETDDLTRNAYGGGEERAYRHLGGSNIAFADGHVQWFAQGKEAPERVHFAP